MAQSTVFVPLKNIKLVSIGGYIITIFGWSSGLLLKLPILELSSVWHRLSPFQRLKMIPGSVGISYIRSVVLAAQICLI